jgi:hypothetical protein
VLGRFVFASLIALLIYLPSYGQFKERDVWGLVTDARGNALPKVAVELENTRSLSVRSYITGKDGRYYFSGLNDDIDFTLKARYRNYWSKPKTLSKFDASLHPEVNLVISVE